MTEFEQDVRQKREVARGACRRKGGARSRRCSLPSDLLTPTQREKLNGPVTTVKLDAPMNWAEYSCLPDHLRREYLVHLVRVYRANQKMLCRMLGNSYGQTRGELERLGIRFPPGGQYPRGQDGEQIRMRWEAFCAGGGTQEGTTTEQKGQENLEMSFEGFPDAARLHQLYERFRGVGVRVHLRVEVTEDE